MSGFCHSLSLSASVLCRTPRLWGRDRGWGEAANRTPDTITAPLERSWIEGAIRTNVAQSSLLQAKASADKRGQKDGRTISHHPQHPL